MKRALMVVAALIFIIAWGYVDDGNGQPVTP